MCSSDLDALKALLEKGSLSTSFFDFGAIWTTLNGMLSDKDSPLYALAANLPQAILDSVKDVLGAELSVPFVGSWAPRMDEAFVNFSLADVPADKGLMAKIVKAAAGYMAASAPSPLDRLMEAKAVAEPVRRFRPNESVLSNEMFDLSPHIRIVRNRLRNDVHRTLQCFFPTVDFFSLTDRSEEHTSELQSRQYLVCRLLLEKKKRLLLTFVMSFFF